MGYLEEMVADARSRLGGLPRVEDRHRPETRGTRFSEALRGRERLSLVAGYQREAPGEPPLAGVGPVPFRLQRYARCGAAAVAVVTEKRHHGGRLPDLELAAASCDLPLLMIDMTVDPAYARVAAALGAQAVLVPLGCLDKAEVLEIVTTCGAWRVEPVLLCTTPAEVAVAMDFPDAVLAATNRDPDTQKVRPRTAADLLRDVPAARVTLAMGGFGREVSTNEVRGVTDAVYAGASLMHTREPESLLQEMLR